MEIQKIAERLLAVAEKYDLEGRYREEDSSVLIRFPLDEPLRSCSIAIYLDEELGKLRAYGMLEPDELIGSGNREALSELIHRINFGLDRGSFVLNFSEGDVMYRTSLIVEDIVPTFAMLEEMLLQIAGDFLFYGAVLSLVSQGKTSPEEAMQQLAEKLEEKETGSTSAQPTPERSSAQVTRFSFGHGLSVDAYFFNGRFGGFTHPDQYEEETEETEYDSVEDDAEEDAQEPVELSWQMSVLSEWLQGREREEYTGRNFAFVSFDPYSDELFQILAEEDSVVKLLRVMGLETKGHGNPNPNSWYGYSELPKYIKKELERNIIAFMLYLQGHFDCLTEEDDWEDDAYLADLPEALPEAEFIIGWSAQSPFQDEAYAVVVLK